MQWVNSTAGTLEPFARRVYVNQLRDTSEQLVRSAYGPNYAPTLASSRSRKSTIRRTSCGSTITSAPRAVRTLEELGSGAQTAGVYERSCTGDLDHAARLPRTRVRYAGKRRTCWQRECQPSTSWFMKNQCCPDPKCPSRWILYCRTLFPDIFAPA